VCAVRATHKNGRAPPSRAGPPPGLRVLPLASLLLCPQGIVFPMTASFIAALCFLVGARGRRRLFYKAFGENDYVAWVLGDTLHTPARELFRLATGHDASFEKENRELFLPGIRLLRALLRGYVVIRVRCGCWRPFQHM